ncbi:MAG: prenylated flavin chaperone LpdD [Candidatus Hodarchaeales archaeon]
MQGVLTNYLKVDSGRTAVCANWKFIGKDLLIVLSGEGQHLGGCSFAEPYQSKQSPSATVSSISRKGHQDVELTRHIAQEVSKRLDLVVVVVGGIHIENATKTEINQIMENSQLLGSRLVDSLAAAQLTEKGSSK